MRAGGGGGVQSIYSPLWVPTRSFQSVRYPLGWISPVQDKDLMCTSNFHGAQMPSDDQLLKNTFYTHKAATELNSHSSKYLTWKSNETFGNLELKTK